MKLIFGIFLLGIILIAGCTNHSGDEIKPDNYAKVMYDFERVPELKDALCNGSFIDLENLRAEYTQNLVPSVTDSVKFESLKYKYCE